MLFKVKFCVGKEVFDFLKESRVLWACVKVGPFEDVKSKSVKCASKVVGSTDQRERKERSVLSRASVVKSRVCFPVFLEGSGRFYPREDCLSCQGSKRALVGLCGKKPFLCTF